MDYLEREASLDVEDEEFNEETGKERRKTANGKQKIAEDFEDSSEEEDDDDDEEAARVRMPMTYRNWRALLTLGIDP